MTGLKAVHRVVIAFGPRRRQPHCAYHRGIVSAAPRVPARGGVSVMAVCRRGFAKLCKEHDVDVVPNFCCYASVYWAFSRATSTSTRAACPSGRTRRPIEGRTTLVLITIDVSRQSSFVGPSTRAINVQMRCDNAGITCDNSGQRTNSDFTFNRTDLKRLWLKYQSESTYRQPQRLQGNYKCVYFGFS